MADETTEQVEEQTEEDKPAFEFTEREKAIARGDDPDAVGQETENENEEVEEEPETEVQAGEDPQEEEGKEAWVTDDLKALAGSYGWTEDQVKGFGSREGFLNAAQAVDRQLTAPPKPDEEEEEKPPGRKDLDLDAFKEAGFDERSLELVEYARGLRAELDELRPVVENFTKQQAQQQEQQQAWTFHNSVDGMDEGRYGRLVQNGVVSQLAPEQDVARRKLFDAAETLRLGLTAKYEAEGREPEIPPLPVLLQRAEMLAFGEDIRKQEREQLRQKVEEQSKRRRPSPGRGKLSAPAQTKESDPVKAIANHPDVVAYWNQAQAENGGS